MQTAESALMDWWFNGLGGLGGWWFFALLAFLAVAYVWLDSQSRNQPVVEWKLGVLFPALFLIPTVIYWFAPATTKAALLGSLELIFLLGLIGGIMPLGVAIAYWIAGPPSYEKFTSGGGPVVEVPPRDNIETGTTVVPSVTPPGRHKSKAGGWLISQVTGRRYDLYKKETRLGRSSRNNDIVFADPSVSREHALVKEDNNVFTLFDRGSMTGTLVEGRRITGPVVLHTGDLITLGDESLKFVSEREV